MYRSGARLIALRAVGDSHAAEDIAQEAVTRAIVALRANPEHVAQDLASFVYGITRHVIADTIRARQREGSGEVEGLVEPRPDALAQAIAREDKQMLLTALRSLSASDRELLELSFVSGMTPGEIAARTQEPVERVRKRKSRSLERLRQAFLQIAGHEPRR